MPSARSSGQPGQVVGAHGSVTVDALTLDTELIEPDQPASADVGEYALRLGDDALILAQQLGWWISRAPELEEDVALGNIALDLIGHARSFLHYAGTASGRSEDDLAYWRDEGGFRSLHLVEQPNGDFAHTIVRQAIVSFSLFELYSRLQHSTDATLAAVAAKAVKEVDYHRDHSRQWMLRLALGTDESRARTVTALADLWPYVDEMFRDDALIGRLGRIAVAPSSLRESFDAAIGAVFAEAEIAPPTGPVARGGGREGLHSEYLAYLLAEMQVLARAHRGATW